MKYVRGMDLADLLSWHPINIKDGPRHHAIHMFLEDYDSTGKYTIPWDGSTCWFTEEKDAVIFRLKFG